MIIQQGDVKLFQVIDEGEILVEDGIVLMNGGLETSAYLSLFGGNEDDDGSADTPFQWWGNLDETERSKTYRSETQNLIEGLPLITSNLRRIEDAAKRDLGWMLTDRVADIVDVLATIPGLNQIKLTIRIEAFGEESLFSFVENWKADAAEFKETFDDTGVVSVTNEYVLLESGFNVLLESGDLLELEN